MNDDVAKFMLYDNALLYQMACCYVLATRVELLQSLVLIAITEHYTH